MLRRGIFYLLCTIEMPEETPLEPQEVLGVDLGVVNLATTSDGTTHSGTGVEACRARYTARRKRLQRATHVAQMHGKRPKRFRQALRRIARKEAGFRRDVNHCISKTLVAVAKGTERGIALEDLKGIRSRSRFRQPQRARMAGWAFAQLRFFVEYKAQLAGVPGVLVDPRHTSQGCNSCGHVARANRQSQARFSCRQCGYTTNADFNAANNIRDRARVKVPLVAVRFRQPQLPLAEPATSRLVYGALRHEVARCIVWQGVSTRPVVPSTVSYVVRQQGNALSKAHGHRTHRHPTGPCTVRERCLCQHQAETGRDGWEGPQRGPLDTRRQNGSSQRC